MVYARTATVWVADAMQAVLATKKQALREIRVATHPLQAWHKIWDAVRHKERLCFVMRRGRRLLVAQLRWVRVPYEAQRLYDGLARKSELHLTFIQESKEKKSRVSVLWVNTQGEHSNTKLERHELVTNLAGESSVRKAKPKCWSEYFIGMSYSGNTGASKTPYVGSIPAFPAMVTLSSAGQNLLSDGRRNNDFIDSDPNATMTLGSRLTGRSLASEAGRCESESHLPI